MRQMMPENAEDEQVLNPLLRVSTAMGDCLRAGKPSRYVTSRLGQLSLPSLRGR